MTEDRLIIEEGERIRPLEYLTYNFNNWIVSLRNGLIVEALTMRARVNPALKACVLSIKEEEALKTALKSLKVRPINLNDAPERILEDIIRADITTIYNFYLKLLKHRKVDDYLFMAVACTVVFIQEAKKMVLRGKRNRNRSGSGLRTVLNTLLDELLPDQFALILRKQLEKYNKEYKNNLKDINVKLIAKGQHVYHVLIIKILFKDGSISERRFKLAWGLSERKLGRKTKL